MTDDTKLEEKKEAAPAVSEETEEEEKEAEPSNRKLTKFKIVLLVIMLTLIVFVAAAFVAKTVFTKQAMENQANYEIICVTLKGELALSSTEEGRALDCVSSIFKTKDGLTLCNSDIECEGACIGDFITPAEYKGACSEGIRLLPRLTTPAQN